MDDVEAVFNYDLLRILDIMCIIGRTEEQEEGRSFYLRFQQGNVPSQRYRKRHEYTIQERKVPSAANIVSP